jgi:hypothetical protein
MATRAGAVRLIPQSRDQHDRLMITGEYEGWILNPES